LFTESDVWIAWQPPNYNWCSVV